MHEMLIYSWSMDVAVNVIVEPHRGATSYPPERRHHVSFLCARSLTLLEKPRLCINFIYAPRLTTTMPQEVLESNF